ncbi:MAG: FtsX-like permease family protein [Ignavibacteriaceae bacterium]
MKLESFIARRYLISKHKINFITIISYLSITGISIGVGALIVVLAVFNGFSDLVTSFFTSFDPHIRIEVKNEDAYKNLGTLEEKIRNAGIETYSPFITSKVLAIQGRLNQVAEIKGIDLAKASGVYGLKEHLFTGEIDTSSGGTGIFIGIQLADKMQLLVGDTLVLVSPAGIERSIVNYSLPNTQTFRVAGIFSTNNQEYDGQLILGPIEAVQNLLGAKDKFQGFELRVKDINNANSFKESFQDEISGEEFEILTWYDLHKNLYSVMEIERWIAYLILSLIIAVAVFNILGSLTMSVIEKKRDIGLLRTIGLRERSITKIFIYQGLYVGVIGTLGGFALGLLVYYLQVTYNVYPLDPTQYKINSLPMVLRISDFFAVGFASFILSLLAAIYPARKAASVNPIDAIKWE